MINNNLKIPEEEKTIKGMVVKVRFHSPETTYSVIDIKDESSNQQITITGKLQEANLNDCLECTGKLITTKKYGSQFETTSICRVLPDDQENMLTYLKAGMIKGIGKKIAERLGKAFGKDLIWVLDNDPQCLKSMRGIGTKTYNKITTSWKNQRAIMALIHEMYRLGLPTSLAVRIQKKYKEKALSVVKNNPYQLLIDLKGLSFEFIDQIGMNVGIPRDSIARILAGMGAVLLKDSLDGHTFMFDQQFINNTQKILKIEKTKIIDCIDIAVTSGRLITNTLISLGVESDKSFMALPHLHNAEISIATKIKRLSNHKRSIDLSKIKLFISEEEKESHIQLNDEQRKAVNHALISNVFIINGGPGSGKTTITRIITGVLKRMKKTISLASLTAVASRRLGDVTKMKASTIHSLLSYQPESESFLYNELNKLDCDVLITDEATMNGAELTNDLLSALSDECMVILVGDYNQLMSIGAGSVFKDIITSEKVPCGELKSIHRQAANSFITQNASLVKQGLYPSAHPEESKESDFYIFNIADPKKIHETVVDLVVNRIPNKFGYDAKTDIQVITPTNKKINGVFSLNEALQERLNPASVANTPRGWKHSLRIGDKVVQTTNNYDLDVYNGDMGKVQSINAVEDEITINFDGRIIEYPSGNIVELMLSHAITIHKSQGSEYNVAIVVLDNETPIMQQRSLIFTAMTRGKKLTVFVADARAIQNSVKNCSSSTRRTTLCYLLKQKMSS